MRKSLLMCAAAAAGLLSLAGEAQAATFTYTYEGVFHFGSDNAGIFGLVGDVTGVGFTAVFTRNDPAPGATITETATRSTIEGGPPNVPVQGSLTVNGITRTFGASFGGIDVGSDFSCGSGCLQEGFLHYASNENTTYDPGGTVRTTEGATLIVAGFGAPGLLPDIDFRTLPSLGLSDGAHFLGRATFYTEVFDEAASQTLSSDVAFEGIMAPTSFRVSTSGAVPEPGAWALMIVGFGTAGAALRRRRTAAAMALATCGG